MFCKKSISLTHSKWLFEFELAKCLVCMFSKQKPLLKINQDHPRTKTPLMLLFPHLNPVKVKEPTSLLLLEAS